MFKVSAYESSPGRLCFARQGGRRTRVAARPSPVKIDGFSPIGSNDGDIWAVSAAAPVLRGKRNAAAEGFVYSWAGVRGGLADRGPLSVAMP